MRLYELEHRGGGWVAEYVPCAGADFHFIKAEASNDLIIYNANRLHQPVFAHRLFRVNRVQARRVKAREPHVSYDHDLE